MNRLNAYQFLRTDMRDEQTKLEVFATSEGTAWAAAAETAGKIGNYGTKTLTLISTAPVSFKKGESVPVAKI